MNIAEFSHLFEPKLLQWVEKKIASYQQYTDDVSVLEWIGYLEKLIRAGGKRIRPYLVFLMHHSLVKEESETVWNVCIGLELFHLFALIHDDIMDKGAVRRGVMTSHRYISQRLKEDQRICEADHIGESQAILLGDLVFSWSYELLNTPGVTSSVKQVFQIMVDEVVIGQMLDVDIMTRSRVSEKLITEKMYLKTAGYTFVQPLLLGATLANADERILDFCKDFGKSLGLAFQIQDDLLDLQSSADVIGKNAFSDLRERQHTYFSQYIVDHGDAKARDTLCELWGKDLTESDRVLVSTLFESSGSLAYGKSIMQNYFNAADVALAASTLDLAKRDHFAQLSAYIRNRTA